MNTFYEKHALFVNICTCIFTINKLNEYKHIDSFFK